MDRNRYPGHHGKIMGEICIYINNRADCYSEDMHKTECNPLNCLGNQVHGITENSFCMEVYGEDVNRGPSGIALQYGYSAGTAVEDGEERTVSERERNGDLTEEKRTGKKEKGGPAC